jgi:hypothetical protein
MLPLLHDAIAAMSSDDFAAFRSLCMLRGFVLVGSTAILGTTTDPDQDVDVVLISEAPPGSKGGHTTAVLQELRDLLRHSHLLVDAIVWYVGATVSILKVQRGEESVDFLWLPGCTMSPVPNNETLDAEDTLLSQAPPPGYVAPPAVQELACDDQDLRLPPYTSAPADSIHLCRVFRHSLRNSRFFTVPALHRLRAFAKQRHVYGSKYGFPGGSAWCAMLWCFCAWLESTPSAPDVPAPSPDEVVTRFLTTVTLWPWPLPWTVDNMAAIVDRKNVDAAALEVSVGRHLSTSFIVPMPIVTDNRVWNMTQCVQQANQHTLLREAWKATTTCQLGPYPNYRNEMRESLCQRHNDVGHVVMRWPVYLSIKLPERSPPEWRGIVGSRIMNLLLPQLQACGFFPRPLCVDTPAYVVLLWPAQSLWMPRAQEDILLPLQDRLFPCLFAMLEASYASLWTDADRQDWAPPLKCLLPELDIHLCDL